MGSKLYVLFKKKKRKKEKKRNDVKGWDMWLKKVASCHMHHSTKKEIIIKGMKTRVILYIQTILQHFYKMLI